MTECKLALNLLQQEWLRVSENIWAYVVGSSATFHDHPVYDLDILLVNPSSRSRAHFGKIEAFRRSVLVGQPERGAFSIREHISAILLTRIATRLTKKFRRSVTVSAIIGPHAPMDDVGNSTVLHVAGPFSLHELRHYFARLPYHGRCFLSQFRTVAGPPLDQLVTCSQTSISTLRAFVEGQFRRAERCETPTGKRRCLRKACLNVDAYLSPAAPYRVAEKIETLLANLGGDPTAQFQALRSCITRGAVRETLAVRVLSLPAFVPLPREHSLRVKPSRSD